MRRKKANKDEDLLGSENEEVPVTEIQEDEIFEIPEEKEPVTEKTNFLLANKNVAISCKMALPIGKTINVVEGKVRTEDVDVYKYLIQTGWVDLNPVKSFDVSKIQRKVITEWVFKLPNIDDRKKVDGSIAVKVNGQNVKLKMVENLITVNDSGIADKLKKDGYVLVTTKS